MNLELKTISEVEGLRMELPLHLMEKFERADRELRELYGQSPGVPALVLMWAGCGTAAQIKREFERAVIEIKKINLNLKEMEDFDEDCR
jgi:hypothetical protein